MQSYYRNYLVSIFISLAVSIGLQMIFPWPYGFIATIAVFVIYPLILRNGSLKRWGNGMGSSANSRFLGNGVGYVCLVCGNKFRGALCPRCGSKMKKAEF
ncbi:MAG: hypothetical protein KGH88_05360 [Thaumarchaeota archaeon]|nr:hypothetical protein [Nitrososphaerota archaeon]